MRRARWATVAAAAAVTLAAALQAHGAPAEGWDVRVGARLVVAMEGTAPSPGLLARIRAGEVGGVFVSTPNIVSAPQLRALTGALHRAAADAGRPRLLIAVDQEGGLVRRVPWAPPRAAAADLASRPLRFVESTGRQTGEALHRLGVDVDLAPVADVPSTPGSFVARQRRALGTSPAKAGLRATAFVRGLGAAGVLTAVKHFPGLGAATVSTDEAAVTIGGTRADLDRGLLPFRLAIQAATPLVMVANAAYAALDGRPAAWSPTARRLLRRELGFEGVSITDAVEPLARTHGVTVGEAAVRAAAAGVDLVLVTGTEVASVRAHDELVAAAAAGRIPVWTFTAAGQRLERLRQRLGG